MEYFDFEAASDAIPPLDLDEWSSICGQANQDDANDSFDALWLDKTHVLPVDPPPRPTNTRLKLINDVEIEVIPALDQSVDYPMYKAKDACEFCAKMGFDCFLASRGAMITGCTCCISLYKDCSFTHPKVPKGFVSFFPGIGEDQVWTDFSREKRRSLKSFDEARGRKTGARFPRDAVKILKQWLAEHADHPYPNEREKEELKQVTGLKRSQISNWLANARRRGKVRPVESGASSPMLGAVDIPGANSNMEDLGPLDRWKASPPEHEPASMTAIARAITSTPLRPHGNSSHSSLHNSRTSSRKASSEDSSGFSMFKAPSVSSFETRESSNSDLTWASSRSNRSKLSHSSAERRRRRRAPMTQRAAAQQAKSRSARIFQCTFCTDTFPAKYDWQRHEKSLHLALERWTCCPEGATITVPAVGCQHCIFCQAPNPTTEHLENHNFLTCQEKTLQERTFYRKDHLRQHLKLMHNAKFEPQMEGWKSTTNEIKSVCGFCPSKFTTWSQRADHLAAHFRNGADMSMWANGWGFEPYVERLVENAIPPYLIGHERQTMDPYVARLTKPSTCTTANKGKCQSKCSGSNSNGSNSGLTFGTSRPDTDTDDVEEGEPDQMTRDSNCWGRLEQELVKFVTRCKLQGRMPSDRELQDQARMIIYEDDDPWNWTCADNEQWLTAFKGQQGLITEPEKKLEEVEVLAPYVVPGGKKQPQGKKGTGAAQAKAKSVAAAKRASTSSAKSFDRPATGYDDQAGAMDLDFGGIDFNNLDLGMDMGDDGLGNLPNMTTGAEMSGQHAPVSMPMSATSMLTSQMTPAPVQTSIDDVFGDGVEMPLDLNLDVGAGGVFDGGKHTGEHAENGPNAGAPFMTAAELSALQAWTDPFQLG